MKKCTKCGSIKELINFSADKRVKKDERRAICTSCTKELRVKSKDRKKSTDRLRYEGKSIQLREYAARYRKKNRSKVNAYDAMRDAEKRRAIPSWANRSLIRDIYDLSSRRSMEFGYQWHVDHIIPLKSPIVCGLHVEYNLQVIPGVENQIKGNRI